MGLNAQQDQEAQLALLLNFAGDAGTDPFNAIINTDPLITTSYRSCRKYLISLIVWG
jgi:hypothetical protein